MAKKLTKEQLKKIKRADFGEAIYTLLRDYQEGKLQDTGECAGQLDSKLTQIYDGAMKALDDYEQG